MQQFYVYFWLILLPQISQVTSKINRTYIKTLKSADFCYDSYVE